MPWGRVRHRKRQITCTRVFYTFHLSFHFSILHVRDGQTSYWLTAVLKHVTSLSCLTFNKNKMYPMELPFCNLDQTLDQAALDLSSKRLFTKILGSHSSEAIRSKYCWQFPFLLLEIPSVMSLLMIEKSSEEADVANPCRFWLNDVASGCAEYWG